MMFSGRHALAAILASLLVTASAEAQQTPAAPVPAQQKPMQDPTGGAAPPVSPPTVPAVAPTPELPASTLAAARDLVIASGMDRSFRPMVPELKEQIVPMLTRTRPDLSKDLDDVMKSLAPEFDKKTDDMIDIAAGIYARRMSEAEMKDAAAFFNSAVGKKYVAVQPAMLDELVISMQAWTTTISNFMMSRVRDEMVKKGHQF